MKRFYLFIVCLIHATVYSQSCLPEGITFNTQSAIDSFQINYPNCTEIEGDVYIERIIIEDSITNLNGLNVLTAIDGDCLIGGPLPSLSGLDNLNTIGGTLLIDGIGASTLEGLNSLVTVGGNLDIGGFDLWTPHGNNLQSLSGLENLQSIGGRLVIFMNVINNLDGFENLTSIGEDLIIVSNPYLSECAIQSVCAYLDDPNGNIVIGNNATGCNTQQEVEDACEAVNVNEITLKNEFSIYPNPASNELFIERNNRVNITDINIYNTVGQIVFQQRQLSDRIDISRLNRGMYIVELVSNEIKIREKLIVN